MPGEDRARRGTHGRIGCGRFGAYSPVDLTVGSVADIESFRPVRAQTPYSQRARDHSLDLEDLGRPVVLHFVRHDPPDVIFQPDFVNDYEISFVRPEPQTTSEARDSSTGGDCHGEI